MQTRRIFLASSKELKDDRVAFELMVGQLNQEWVPRGTFFHLVVWENFIDAMSSEGLQQEYNKAITGCDIFVLLFFTKVGQHTSEEFEAAFGAFTETKKPLIYTYFKDDIVLTGDLDESVLSMLEFKKRLTRLNHYYTRYRSAEELKWLFSRQLDKLFGDSLKTTFEVTDATPQSEVDAIALALVNRYLSELDGRTSVDVGKLKRAVTLASELARHTIFLLASQVRQQNWADNKAVMERTIPVFQALIDADQTKHYYFGQLAYAQKDQANADHAGARSNFDKAMELLDPREVHYGSYYRLNRAICEIRLDARYLEGKPSEAATRQRISDDLKAARSKLPRFAEIVGQPWNLDLKRWIALNERD